MSVIFFVLESLKRKNSVAARYVRLYFARATVSWTSFAVTCYDEIYPTMSYANEIYEVWFYTLTSQPTRFVIDCSLDAIYYKIISRIL